jgi:hypothetical protein
MSCNHRYLIVLFLVDLASSFSSLFLKMSRISSVPSIVHAPSPIPNLQGNGFSVATYNVLMPNRRVIDTVLLANAVNA